MMKIKYLDCFIIQNTFMRVMKKGWGIKKMIWCNLPFSNSTFASNLIISSFSCCTRLLSWRLCFSVAAWLLASDSSFSFKIAFSFFTASKSYQHTSHILYFLKFKSPFSWVTFVTLLYYTKLGHGFFKVLDDTASIWWLVCHKMIQKLVKVWGNQKRFARTDGTMAGI